MSALMLNRDVDDLLRQIRGLVAGGRVAAARPLLSAVQRLAEPSPEMWEIEARLLLREGRGAEAFAVLDRALALRPDSVSLRLCRAGARADAGELALAAADAADAVLLAPGDAPAKALLGAVLLELGRAADARACLAEALRAVPQDLDTRLALARAEETLGDWRAALAVLQAGIALAPARIGLRTAAILLLVKREAFAEAVAMATTARADGATDACVLGLLGHALSSLGRHDDASGAYAEALKLAPEDPYVRHLVAAAGLVPDLGRAPPDYVRVVFDGYAPRFDAHLMGLGYRIPGLVRAVVAAAPAAGPVLDLGCGTGLMAVALSDLPLGPTVGVDLSRRMLAAAAQRGLYAELHECDIEAFLAAEPRRFALLLAGDVCPYFGDLTPLLRGAAARLEAGGRFVFSAEALADATPDARGWQLGKQGRYRHGAGHILAAAAAAGLTVEELRPEVVRYEGEAPVPGLLAVLRSAAR
ncbi:MAG: tetratricopeptide repeat protein [Alphaproteobacteria bacterium]|nr:tetratricopeptide repeat protein [Alphaproteobacteria bacterium]